MNMKTGMKCRLGMYGGLEGLNNIGLHIMI